MNTFNAGLRGRKTMYYEGGHRVPCWVRWPNGKLGEPRDIAISTQNTDLLPTLCEWCEVPAPKRVAADSPYLGTSLAGLFANGEQGLPERSFVVQYGQTPAKFDCCVINGRWRLVKGTELYDVAGDLEQKNNMAAMPPPDFVKRMRDYFEWWWKGVEPLVNEFVPQSILAKLQPVVELTSGVWENIYADNSGFVREAVGGPTGGRWHIKVESAGEYQFTLRRWPEISGAALGRQIRAERQIADKQAERQDERIPDHRQSEVSHCRYLRRNEGRPDSDHCHHHDEATRGQHDPEGVVRRCRRE